MNWLTPALSSAVISMAVFVAAYAYLYGKRRRQSDLGLWALGWAAYLGLYLGLLAEMFLPLAMLWRYLSLVLLGFSAFLLWAGTRHFVGSPPSRRAYAWGVLPVIWAAVAFLGLVFGHLVDNAIKFSPDGGTVTVRAWADGNQVYVSVADEGIGIAPDHLNRVFERFYQVDGTTKRRFGGMGVGLAPVWEIVEAHGGTVTVGSEPGEGSTFTVALPQAEESSAD